MLDHSGAVPLAQERSNEERILLPTALLEATAGNGRQKRGCSMGMRLPSHQGAAALPFR